LRLAGAKEIEVALIDRQECLSYFKPAGRLALEFGL